MHTTYPEESILLEHPKLLSHVYVWLIIAMVATGLTWTAIAEIEQSIAASGQLEPKRSTQEVKAPAGGVVQTIHVKDGQSVKKGQLLVRLDPTAPQSDLTALAKLKTELLRENSFYTNSFYTAAMVRQAGAGGPDLALLTQLRNNLSFENQTYQAQLSGLTLQDTGDAFTVNQQKLLNASLAERTAQTNAAELKKLELQKQLTQTRVQLQTAQQSRSMEITLRDRLQPLVAAGGISQVQFQQQEQGVLERQAEVQRLEGEVQKLTVSIDQVQEQTQQAIATAEKEILGKIASNQNRIAELDSQLNRIRLENQKKLTEIEGQMTKAKQALQYQDLRAPVDGVVFNLQPRSPGFVVNGTQPLLSIVPKDHLIASVYLKNKDIGFVKPGMAVDVKLESFPEQEFGSINGTLLWVGSDVLPPDQSRPYAVFPAKIQLDRQQVMDNDQPLLLQSGMAVTCNIKLRKRTVLSLFLDLFNTKTTGLKTVR